MRLRPTGKSGSLVMPLREFRRYFVTPESSDIPKAAPSCGNGRH